MPYQIKQLSGIMDTDSPLESIPLTSHRSGRNTRFRNGRVESIVGNIEISVNLPAGTNENVGAFYDGIRQRIFFFNYNSNGRNGIYKYDINTGLATPLLVSFTNSSADIFGFSLSYFIADIDILYTTEDDGDILHWVQRNGEAKRLNIKEAETNLYGSNWLESYLTVIKAPPMMPPKVVYENDANVTINNVRKALFQFAQIFWYSNDEKSVWSPRSIVPLPNQPSLQLTEDTITNNSRISISVNTGNASVFKFGLAFRQVKNGSTSDWFLIDTFDKTSLSISNDTIYTYNFYNDGLYTPLVDPDDGDILQLQDYVPRLPQTQALLNGNVLSLGGGVEGFNPVATQISVAIGVDASGFYYDYNGLLFYAVISGIDSGSQGTTMKVYLNGTGTNTTNIVSTLNNSAAIYVINAVNGSFASVGISVTNTTNSTTVAALLASISAALVVAGWTQVSIVNNVLTVTYPSTVTLYSSGTKLYSSTLQTNTTSFAYPFQAGVQFGIMYFALYGRTPGTFTNIAASFQTSYTPVSVSPYNYPQPIMSVAHRPPLYATHWAPVRIDNSTYLRSKKLEWITQSAYSSGLVASPGQRYVYLGISNIATYNADISATEGVVGYSFAQGDRVRFVARYDVTGALQTINSPFDYEILGTETNPKIDGQIKQGTFVKILYPTNDISVNFKFDGTEDFLHYEIMLYGTKEHAIGGNNVFFESGKMFGIGNAGTANAYHIGLDQTQSVNLVTPAKVSMTNGDLFWRQRTVPYGETYTFDAGGTDQDETATLLITVPTTINNTAYQIQSQAENTVVDLDNPALFPTYADTPFFYNKLATAALSRIIKLRGTFTVYNNVPELSNWSFGVIICTNLVPFDPKYYIELSNPKTVTVQPNDTYVFEIDATVSVPPTGKVFPYVGSTSASIGDVNIIQSFDLTIEVTNSSTIEIIESSFSDVIKLDTNSNGRESIVEPNMKEVTNDVLVRWSLPYQQNTNINGANNFRFLNFDEVDRGAGAIQRFLFFKKKLIVFQELKSGRYGVYSKYIRNNSGESELVVTDEILTKNNIQYYESGEYGLGKQYTALSWSENAVYFVYPITGALLRIAGDGITNLSELYKGQYFLSNLMDVYNNDWTRPNGSPSKIMMFFDNYEEQAMTILQGGVRSGLTIPNESFSFNENRNGFYNFYDYLNPDNMLCAENTTYAWKNGRMYKHTDEVNWCNFFGTQYYPSIQLIFNDQQAVKKNFNTLAYQGNQKWNSPNSGDIFTTVPNGQTGEQQVSKLPLWSVEIDEGRRVASFLRDINSMSNPTEALVEGDFLQGNTISVNLSYIGTEFAWLFAPYIGWQPNSKNL